MSINTNVLEVIYAGGRPKSFKTTSFVGVIRIGNWTIEILPKTEKDLGEDKAFRQAVRNLLYMLSFTKKLTVKQVDVSMLHKVDDDFFEVLIYLYAKNLIERISRNLFKNYVNCEENFTFLKGKLKFSEHITYNAIFANRFFAQFDEFSEDNRLNRILKYTTQLLLHVSRNFANVKLLQQLALMLDDVSFTRIGLSDFERVHLTRLNEEYGPILNLCKLFISQSSLELSADEMPTFSFIFDMNVLFEEFIGEFVRRHFSDHFEAIHLQRSSEYLVDKVKKGEEVQQTHAYTWKPDIALYVTKTQEKPTLLLDTKYKKLTISEDSAGSEKRYGVASGDMYQMCAYSLKYECPDVIILYPQMGGEAERFTLCVSEQTKIHVRTVDISRDLRATVGRKALKEELETVLKVTAC